MPTSKLDAKQLVILMDALIKQLVEALVLSRLALDRVDAIPLNAAEISRVREMAEAAIQAAINYELGRTLLSKGEDGEDDRQKEKQGL